MVERFVAASLTLVLLCLCYRISMRLLYGARGPAVDDSIYLFMRIFSWGLLLAPAAVLAVVTVSVCIEWGRTASMPGRGWVAGPMASTSLLIILTANWITVLCLAVMLEAAFELVMRRRSVQRRAAWRQVAASLARGRSAIESLRFHEPRFTGIVGRWYRRLVADLERGAAWPTAIWENRRAFPREAPARGHD